MKNDITRREFIALNIAASVAVMSQTRLDRQLTAREKLTLLAVARSMFPHEHASDMAYARGIAAIERQCRFHSEAFTTVVSGLASLEWSCGGQFCAVTHRMRVQALSAMEDTKFFRLVYRRLLDGLYGNSDMWSLFLS